MMRLKPYVTRGMKVLDQAMPGWWRPGKIDLDVLDMSSCDLCILGQLYDDGTHDGYERGREELGRLAVDGKLKLPRGVRVETYDDDEYEPDVYGEDIGCSLPEESVATFKDLDDLWAAEIKARRRAAHLRLN